MRVAPAVVPRRVREGIFMRKFRNVAVLSGGVSSEREVSLRSGEAVAGGLGEAGYNVALVVLEREAVEGLPAGVEAVFIALHGGYGENGGVQADLDRLGLPYTGSGAAASRLAMDKVATKRLLAARGVPTPEFEVLAAGESRGRLLPPLVVKPPRDGSSVGVTLVRRPDEWAGALAAARQVDSEVLVERYIAGREWTVGVLDGEALPPIEILAPGGWYDYEAKYVAGLADYCFPECSADAVPVRRCRELALETFRAVGARGPGRVDFRLDADGTPWVLELNTIPGFTATSLLPKAAARAGIGFSRLCARIMELARHDGA
jgi:D-alanine-D-alanine ligase